MKLSIIIISISFVTGTLNLLSAQTQTRVISGTVNDTKGQPIPGVSVLLSGTTTGTYTDINGKFQLAVTPDAKTIVVSFVGLKSREVDIAGKSSVAVVMEEESYGLEEVVIVGYGVQKKVTVTGAVASVQSQQLLSTPVANVSTAIIGRSSGVLAVQRSGEPGEDASTLRIRGVGTFSGGSDPLIMVDGIETKNYNNIDPNEIETVTVLKDASATAVYGVRGANGVLIITTKRGTVGKPQVSYSGNFAANQFAGLRKRMDAYEYTWGFEQAKLYDSYISGAYVQVFTPDDVQKYKDHSDPIFHPDVDWMDVILKDIAYQNQHNINIRGGTENVKYFISMGRFHQGGLFNNTNLIPDFYDLQTVYNRYNFRSNFDFKITKRLSASLDVSSQIGSKKGMNAEDASSELREISIANPASVPGFYDGKILTIQSPKAGSQNPLSGMYSNGYAERYSNNMNGSVRVNYDLDFITKGLTVHGLISYKNLNNHNISFYKSLLTYTAIPNPQYVAGRSPSDSLAIIVPNNDDGPVSINETVGKNRQTYAEFGFDYVRSFGPHNFTGKIMYNQGKTFDPGYQYGIPSGYQGLVGRVSYDYRRKYLAEFNMGYNGTEQFALGKRFGFFPAFSLGWVMSDESFFPKNNIVTFLKFRGSYGEVGNDKIGGSRFLYMKSSYTLLNGNTYPNKPSYYFGLAGAGASPYTGAREGKMGNEAVTWERAKKTDIGVEINLLKDKITISADYFYEKRDNILSTIKTIPNIIGVIPILPAVNLGKMKNRGIDGEATINLKAGKFNYWIKGTYSFARNTILFQDEVPSPYLYQMSTGQSVGQNSGRIAYNYYNSWDEVSDPYRPRYNYQNNRIQPGDPNIKDINGDGVVDQYDSGWIGYSDFPEIVYGISVGGDWKGFDFSVLLQGTGHLTFTGPNNYNNHWNAVGAPPQYITNSWSLEKYTNGELITFPRYYVNGGGTETASMTTLMSSVNASYIRIKNAEIAYTIKSNPVFSAIGISNARVYINGSNLWLFCKEMAKVYPGVDPEDQGTYMGSTNREPYPRTRVLNIGLNVNF